LKKYVKKYLDKNVYEAAKERLGYIFKNFRKMYVSFSGGKDSSVLLNMALDYAKRAGYKRKIGVLFIDLEGQYSLTIDHIREILSENAERLEVFWVCLPLNLRNAVSVFQPFWTCWDGSQRDKWIREYPDFPNVITAENNPFPFFREKMEFEEFVPEFGKWYAGNEKTACLVGIRSDESLNRYRTIKCLCKDTLDGRNWTTKISENFYNVYPIYDWSVSDVWVANAKLGWKYNRLYDLFYKAGVPIASQRICQPYGDDQRKGLNLFRIVEPDTWAKVVNRVSGANYGNIYCGRRIMGYRKVSLPAGHTWKSYCKLLLATLPKEMSDHYKRKFRKFMLHWHRRGSPVHPDELSMLPECAVVSGGASPKVKYKKIPDCVGGRAEQLRITPSWRRMCVCILKNDFLCTGLSFSQTKRQQERMKALLEKYRNL